MQKSKALIPPQEDSAANNCTDDHTVNTTITKMKAVGEFDAENEKSDERPHYTVSQIIKIARDSW